MENLRKTWGFFKNLGKTWENTFHSKSSEPLKNKAFPMHPQNIISFSQFSNLNSLCSCRTFFCSFTKSALSSSPSLPLPSHLHFKERKKEENSFHSATSFLIFYHSLNMISSPFLRREHTKKKEKEEGRMLCFQEIKREKKKIWMGWKLYFKKQLLWGLEGKNLILLPSKKGRKS